MPPTTGSRENLMATVCTASGVAQHPLEIPGGALPNAHAAPLKDI